MGPFVHPDRKLLAREPHRFLLARYQRDDDGIPVDAKKKKLDVTAEDWRTRAAIVSFDPFADLDIIVTINTTWASGAKNWALTVTGVDPALIRYQLETRAGDGGAAEWVPALRDVAQLYKPRVIGMDRKGYSDAVVQNMLRTDVRVSSLRRRVVGVDQADVTEEARIRAGVAEPLKTYRLLLLASSEDTTKDYGASITRKEMLMFRAGSERTWPILDSLAMTSTLLLRSVPTREQRDMSEKNRKVAEMRYRSAINPALGVPSVA